MKNLKKVLSLGLALVMLLGMFTVASAATSTTTASDLTDWNTVQHQDAVSLMVDLGIIVGLPDGSFSPTGNIDRASWAKMVYYAATGSDNADAYLGTATGLGDIAGNWAESYISFLKANNYISGDNYGNYNPSNNVTVAEACKMMLTVLGYDAEDRGYQNDTAWAGNIMTDAKRNGLLDNVDSEMTSLTPLTRENAAEIVLNALNANMVEGEPQWDGGVKHIGKYNKLYTLGYDVFNLVKVTAIVDGIDKDGLATITTVTAPEGFNVASSINSKVKAAATLVGEEVDVYVKAEGFKWDDSTGEISTVGTFKSVISSSAAKAAATPIKVLTGGFAMSDVTTRSSSNYVASTIATDCAYYINGKKTTASGLTTANIGQRGTVAEFYVNTDGEISVVKVYYYTADKVEGTVTTKTLSDGTVQVRVPGVISGYVDVSKVNGWQGLEDGDVVLYYTTTPDDGTSSDKAYTIEKAESITGKVTTYSSAGALTINGQSYRMSGQNIAYTDAAISQTIFENWTNTYSLSDEFNFWLDKNGSIVVAQQVTESLDSSKVCMVIETEVTSSSLGTSGSLAANLLFADGTTEIVYISKVSTAGGDLKTVVDSLSSNTTTAAKQITSTEAQKAIAGSKDSEVLKKFFNYRATSSGYELTELSASLNSGRDWENVVTAGSATIMKESVFAKVYGSETTALSGMLTADSATTFIIGKVNNTDNSVTYSVVKGFRNLHEMDATMVTAIAVNSDASNPTAVNKVAKYVYLETGSFKDDAPEGYIFITGNGWTADPELYDDDVYLVNIVDTDGSATTMRVDYSLKNSIAADSNKLNASPNYLYKFWQIGSIDEDGVVSSLGDNGDGVPAELKNIEAMGNDVITFVDGTSYDYDSATQFVYVDLTWEDDTDDSNNTLGVREPSKDKWVLSESGTFDPENFFNSSEVDDTGCDSDTVENQNPSGVTYIKVLGAVIVPSDSTTADYVYVVRYLW